MRKPRIFYVGLGAGVTILDKVYNAMIEKPKKRRRWSIVIKNLNNVLI